MSQTLTINLQTLSDTLRGMGLIELCREVKQWKSEADLVRFAEEMVHLNDKEWDAAYQEGRDSVRDQKSVQVVYGSD